ncbi:MAG: nucleotidyltransferase domain-containing protein [Bacillota bacterium]
MNEKVEQIVEHLKPRSEVSAIWLFGSVAQGKAGVNSDIDIAVLFIDALSPMERFDLRLELMNVLEDIAGCAVDVIDMEAASLFLQHQIRKTGRLLFEEDHQKRVEFDVRSRRDYFDLEYRYQQRARIIERNALGG